MNPPDDEIDPEVLAEALREVAGAEAEQSLRGGPQSVALLVRRLLASPSTARKLLDVFTARAVARRSEMEPPVEFGPVVTDDGTYDDPPLMLDPIGSPEFERAIDSMFHPDAQRKDR
ncbi:hypothetical protein [Piscinibacter defluvii]|uniref:hypothetical protein n=1 Tax=Piscinibacter defluvii TaxID=1796922 RepID=UPI000FDE8E1A|nr:hypothetical protein [Piscinibacter defluvii]